MLVHRSAAERLVGPVVEALQERGVTVHGDESVQALASDVTPATDEDWATEYLSLDLAMRVVDDLDEYKPDDEPDDYGHRLHPDPFPRSCSRRPHTRPLAQP